MNCPHDITERDVAVSADGYCPLCQAEQIDKLRKALKRYGLHEGDCPLNDPGKGKCTCGFDGALNL